MLIVFIHGRDLSISYAEMREKFNQIILATLTDIIYVMFGAPKRYHGADFVRIFSWKISKVKLILICS